jgi:tetratricopeptide (TPR) repeat protein
VPPQASPSPASQTVAEIAGLQARLAVNPDDESALTDLGFALLQRVRETADPSLYGEADKVLAHAAMLQPDDPLVLVATGGLQLGRHEFADALETGRAALAILPDLPAARAIEVDALVELGRYDEADAAAERLLALRQDIVSLPRISYLRELHGDLAGALEAMRTAAASAGVAPENAAYVTALLGTLLVKTGDTAGAEAAYQHALELVPNHAPAIAGLGRLAVARSDLDEAIRQFERASAILPLPEYVIALGEAQEAAGDKASATKSYDLARAEIKLFEAAGVTVDLELALFEADHGDPSRALALAQAAYDRAPTIRAADALAWALHRSGRDDEAKRRSDEALRLGSKDPLLQFHAGAIAAALGDVPVARTALQLALDVDAGFSATGAAEARKLLAALPG